MTSVRPAIPADVDSILELTNEMDRFYGVADSGVARVRSEQLYDALFGHGLGVHALVAVEARAVVGFATYSFVWPAVGLTHSLYVKELFVSSQTRRRGIGGAMMDSLVTVARGHGCSRIEWTTDSDNDSAREFYGSLGFEQNREKLFYRCDL